MTTPAVASTWGKRLVFKVTCPNCWHTFPPEDICFIAKHPSLFGKDPVVDEEYLRFHPLHFNLKGEALDEKGMTTTDLACPRCHLQIADVMLEVQPVFASIVGAPACGKSYFLAAMTWELRRLMPRARISFTDADPTANRAVHEYEHTIFLNPRPDELARVAKTQRKDPRLHKFAKIEGTRVTFPTPFQFTLWPTPDHPRFADAHKIGRIIVLYDNAGEDFLPGREEAESAAIQHLAKSQILFLLFDPVQDPRLRAELQSDDPQLKFGLRPGMSEPMLRQETLLREMSVRVRRYLGLAQDKRISKPLFIIVPKFDTCRHLLDVGLEKEPYTVDDKGYSIRLDVPRIESTSDKIRDIFRRVCPEFVATADSLSENVRYLPVSSLGTSPEWAEGSSEADYWVRPRNVKSQWVAVPMLYALTKWAPGLLACSSENA